mgnify:CR=1 FL=1
MTKTASEWFTVDRQGLSELRENADPASLLYELFQNIADEDGATSATLGLVPDARGRYLLTAQDDVPGGFRDLKDAYRLFARSYKREHAEKRGRFNVGEKLVLALAESATVTTTSGSVSFNPDGTRSENLSHLGRTERGTRIAAIVRLTKSGAEQAITGFRRVLPPAHLTTTLNGESIPYRAPDLTVAARALPTVLQGPDGWRTTQRNTTLSLYAAKDSRWIEAKDCSSGCGHAEIVNGQAYLYEMGIPVVEIDGRWSVSVGQKVPLTLDRDNVPPAYLRRIYVEVANATADQITPDDATATWTKEALEDSRTTPEAIHAIIVGKFGEKAVAFDPSDKEGSVIAAQRGYEVVGGRSLSAAAWANVRDRTPDLLRPAGQVTPSPRMIETSAEGKPSLDPDKWTDGMRAVARYSMAMAQTLQLRAPVIHFDSAPTENWAAAYSPGSLRFNYGRLGKAWFDNATQEDTDALLTHEFAHDPNLGGVGHNKGWNNHQSEEYHSILCWIAARLRTLAEKGVLPHLARGERASTQFVTMPLPR